MRFIGNKTAIVSEIYDLLDDKNLISEGLVFFDGFSGTSSVGDYFKDLYEIKSNDLLTWSTVYARGRLSANQCTFKNLGFDPFDYFNVQMEKKIIEGFFYNNYSPANSDRMYFSEFNAGRIDFFRQKIEEWYSDKYIDTDEYSFLLASLIESLSTVANVAGVYGAFLKKWDSRALKDIKFIKVVSYQGNKKFPTTFYNDKIENIISNVDCDILYLDPPYTQNQYGTQYHLLETLILYDEPSISPITGSRSTTPLRSDWSKDFKSHILLDKILYKTKAKYIVLSYSSDGFMSKQYIEAVFKRYGKKETFICKEIRYDKYKNFKTTKSKNHFEYLFFIEKKDTCDIIYESPLNYTGSKYKLITEIKEYLPNNYKKFVDVFGGGFNVGINIAGTNEILYNDLNWIVKDLVESFRNIDTYDYLMYIRRTEKKFGLTASNSEAYIEARNYYNSLPLEKRDPRLLYTIIIYGFQQQIRFNSKLGFNNPVGMRWFNDNLLEKFISFSRVIKEKSISFSSYSFDELTNVNSDYFIYMDPPYRLTTGSYNDGKRGFEGWTQEHEQQLMEYADKLNSNNIKFMISYVLEHSGIENTKMKKWLKKNNYKVIKMNPTNSRKRKEIIIINYDQL